MKKSKLPDSQPPDGPPRWADKLVEWCCAPHLREEVLGDLHERYYRRAQRLGAPQARRQYRREVLAYVRPSFLKRKKSPSASPSLPNPDMIRNYLKIAWRNLARHKTYSVINIGGLAAGMAVALLIGLWLLDELSFDRYHANYDHVAQVMKRSAEKGKQYSNDFLPYPLAQALKTNYGSHFKHILLAWPFTDHILAAGDRKFSRTGQFIEAGAPDMLSLNMLAGTRDGLRDPHSVLLSASTAKALFGDENPMDKALKINNTFDVKVTGVYEDLPHNTTFSGTHFFAPWDLWLTTNAWIEEQGWANHNFFMYAQVGANTTVEEASARITDAEINIIRGLEGLETDAALKPEIYLYPMDKWHLYQLNQGAPAGEPPYKGGLLDYVWMIGIIGVFVLLLACINFMNLSTARSATRAKEVGIRKAVGSMRQQLIGQFFSESFLVVLLAYGLALLLATLSLPWFNGLASKEITMPWTNPLFWLAGLGFVLITGLLAGSYPALYLSSFQAVQVLKGTFRAGRLAAVPRKVLVVVQFTVSVVLIIGTLTVYRQIGHAKNRPVGYTRDGLVMVNMKSNDFYGKYDLLRGELLRTGAVAEMSQSLGKVTEIYSQNGGFEWKGKDPNLIDGFGTLGVTHEYGKTVGWQFVAGRDFSRDFASDSTGFVVNEAAVKYMGLKDPVGEIVRQSFLDGRPREHRILGVVKDMVMRSPFEPARPTIFFINGYVNWINIKINPAVSAAEALPKIEAVFKKLIPSAPFDYKFADEEYAAKFAVEERIGKLAAFFASLAVFISCLGLFGLASFTAEQRTKEIGIRKVLGASVANLWGLLSRDFVYLVLIAFGVAAPIAYFFLSGWLGQYEYRTGLAWWVFALSGGGALVVTLLTVTYQALKAALANPVRSLRNE